MKPGFWVDERIVSVSDSAKLLYQGLWGLADREGKLEHSPMTIGFQVRPWAPNEVPALLAELIAAGLVVAYEVAGRRYLLVPTLPQHQRFHPKEQARGFPDPPPRVAGEVNLGAAQLNLGAPQPPASKAGSSEPSEPSEPAGPSGPSDSVPREKRARPAKPAPDPRFGPLVGQLKAVQPTFTDADGAALKTLLARGETPEEILTRFRRGVGADQYSPKCATVLQLLQRWPELGIVRGTGPPTQRREEPTSRPQGRVAEI